MKKLIENLCSLGFTRLEAQIYFALLANGRLSGYQIAKKIGASRSSVYPALEVMLKKGYVLLLPGELQIFMPQNPQVLIGRLKSEFFESAAAAEDGLKDLYSSPREERFVNILGFDNIVSEARQLLHAAQKEVCINTDFDLHLFESEFSALAKRHVRVVVFSFAELNHDGLGVEFYTHGDPACCDEMPSRMMLAADMESALIADTQRGRGTWLGTVTNNALMVSIVCEHIHNDIYLLKLKEKYGGNLIGDDILLHTRFEGR